MTNNASLNKNIMKFRTYIIKLKKILQVSYCSFLFISNRETTPLIVLATLAVIDKV